MLQVVSFDNMEDEVDEKPATSEDLSQDWDSIIPEDTRKQVEEEERQKQLLELHLPPRSRKTVLPVSMTMQRCK